MIVDNTAGADGLIGTRKVIESRPDGYTLLVQLNSLTLLKHLPTFKGTDPVTQLVPVSAFASLPVVLVANAKLPIKTVAELTQYCKANPCSFGTTENVARLQAQMYKAETGIDNLVVVNYKGGGQLITDLVANNVNVAIMGITAAMPHYKSGALRVLASAGKKRSPVMPEVPSALEAGMPGMDDPIWYGVFAPKDTPANIVQGIAAAVHEAVKGDEVKKTFAVLGSERDRQLAGRVRDDGQRKRPTGWARSSSASRSSEGERRRMTTASVGAAQAPDFLRVAPR